MPRQRSARSSAPAPTRSPVKNPPQPAARGHPPVKQGGGSMLGGIGSTIAEGMAFGTGSAVAHRAVDAVLGPRTVQHEYVDAPASAASQASASPLTMTSGSDACGNHIKAFQECVNNYGSDISKCQFYIDMLNECRRGSSSVSF